MPFADINGFRMHYETRGKGPPLVIAHGLLSSSAMAELLGEVPPYLANDFTIITYDSRGHGESGGTTQLTDYCWDSLSADLLGLLDHLGIESAYFSGSSMGGGTILYLAIRRPAVVRKIVLLSPPPVGQQQSAPGAALLGGFAMLVEGLGLKEAVNIVLRMKPWADMKKSAPMIHQLIKHWMLSLNAEAIVPAIRGIVYGPALSDEDLKKVQAPTLLVPHPNDEMHPVASAEYLHSQIPGSRLVVAPDAFYYSLRRDELSALMRDFLNGASTTDA